ncbi:MAG: hypothetical protein Q9217_000826 [Psora testacea]
MNGEQDPLEHTVLEEAQLSAQDPQASNSNVASPSVNDQQPLQFTSSSVPSNNFALTSQGLFDKTHQDSEQYQGSCKSGLVSTSTSIATGDEPQTFDKRSDKKPRVLAQVAKQILQGYANEARSLELSQPRDMSVANSGKDRIESEKKLKGRVRGEGGSLDWYDEKGKEWRHADYHSNWRHEFIELDRGNTPYVNTPIAGGDSLDVTSNCSYLGQHAWEFETPEQLALILDDDGNQVMVLNEAPDRSVRPEPRYWIHRGMVMLDQDDNAVFAWPNIPRCFSSALEGERMEALRRVFPWLRANDFRARMPQTCKMYGKFRSVYGFSTLRHRTSRWRDLMKLPAWDKRPGPVAKERRWRGADDTSNISASDNLQLRSPSIPRIKRKRSTTSAKDYDEDSNPGPSTKMDRSGGQAPAFRDPHPTSSESCTSPVNCSECATGLTFSYFDLAMEDLGYPVQD